MCCAKQVSELLNCPIVSLFGSGMDSTGVNVIVKHIQNRLFATTRRECQFHENWDMYTDTSGEGLTETSRPGLIPVMRPDHPEKPSWFVPQGPLLPVYTQCLNFRLSQCLNFRRETANVRLRSLNGCHRAMICCVTLCRSRP